MRNVGSCICFVLMLLLYTDDRYMVKRHSAGRGRRGSPAARLAGVRDYPRGGVRRKQALAERGTRHDDGTLRQGDGLAPEVGYRPPATGTAEVEYLPGDVRHPLQVLRCLQAMAPAQCLPVERER